MGSYWTTKRFVTCLNDVDELVSQIRANKNHTSVMVEDAETFAIYGILNVGQLIAKCEKGIAELCIKNGTVCLTMKTDKFVDTEMDLLLRR